MHFLQCPFDPPPRLLTAGMTVASPGWLHPRRRLDSYELLLGKRGLVYVNEESDVLELRPGRLLMLTAGRFHGGSVPIEVLSSFYWLHFASSAPQQLLSETKAMAILANREVFSQRLIASALLPQVLDLKDPAAVEVLFRGLLHEQQEPCYTPYKLQLLLHLMLVDITTIALNHYQETTRASTTSGLAHSAVADIANRLTDPDLSVKSIASRLERNPDYLGREFKSLTGVSVGEYIVRQRIILAEDLLRNGSGHIPELAEQCGFSTIRHFQRQFHRLTGMSPSEYRARQQSIYITTR